MFRSLRQLYGKKLGASDGDIGHVKDFYFNDAVSSKLGPRQPLPGLV